jgi:hypothetical protein
MKKSILILTVSAFYLIACGDSAQEHDHSDEGGHSHDENGDHIGHEGHDHEGDHQHDHDNEQESFVIDSIEQVVTPSEVSKPDIVPTTKVVEDHGGHDHNHGDHGDHKH